MDEEIFILDGQTGLDANTAFTESTDVTPASTTSNTSKRENLGSVGVIVVSEGKILVGTRHNDTGYGLICGPGGHIEEGETPEQAAVRETQEEFGITPKGLMKIGRGPKEPDTGLEPHIFLCTDWDGEVKCDNLEMVDPKFCTMQELEDLKPSLFQPFADDLVLLMSILGPAPNNDDGGENATKPKADKASQLADALCKTKALRESRYSNTIISEKPIDKSAKTGTITSEETHTDGAPYGNQNAAGPHKKSLKQKLDEALIGQKTSNGLEIKSYSSHAKMRFGQRHVKPKKALEALQNPDYTLPGNEGEGNRTVYVKGRTRVIFDNDEQEIKTVYEKTRGRKNAKGTDNGGSSQSAKK